MKDNSISIVLITTILLALLPESFQRCCSSRDPEFRRKIAVNSVSPYAVSVSWKGSLNNKDCADNFEIFYWKTYTGSRSNNQKQLSKDRDGTVHISVSSATSYTFQIKAIEPQGFELFGIGCKKKEIWSSPLYIETMKIGNVMYSYKLLFLIFKI